MKLLYACLISLQILAGSEFSRASNVDCSEPPGQVSAEDSPSLEYFKSLVSSASDVPLESFLVLWYPNRIGAPALDPDLQRCAEKNSCPGDTGYSWGRPEKVMALKKTMPDGEVWSGNPYPKYMLDTLFSAVGSFGYGSVPIRLRFKSPIQISPEAEHIVADAAEIESWSYGTPEHYDEIVRDYVRYIENPHWYGYFMVQKAIPGDPLFFKWPLDGHTFSEANLKAALLRMINMILNHEGKISYAKGVCRNRQREFETDFPTYINPMRSNSDN